MRYYKQDDLISRVASDGAVHHRLVGDRLWIDGDSSMVCGDEIPASEGQFSIDHYEVAIMDDDSWGYTTPLAWQSGFLTKQMAIECANRDYSVDLELSHGDGVYSNLLRAYFLSKK